MNTAPPLDPKFESIVQESLSRFREKYPMLAWNTLWISDYETEIRRTVTATVEAVLRDL